MGNDRWKHEMHLCIHILTCWGTDLLSRVEFDENINTAVRSICKVTAGNYTFSG